MNPFSVGIAQGIAGVDVFSGAGFRMVMWVVFTALGCGMTMFYAAKVKKTPEISVAYESDQYFRDQNEKTGIDEGHSFGSGHILVLVTLAVTVVWVIWGVMAKGYYMAEIATQFFIMGIVAGVIGVIFHLNDMKVNDIAVSFKDGAKDLIGAALVVAMAQGIMQVLGGSDPTTPTVINTIMYGISQALAGSFRCSRSRADVCVPVGLQLLRRIRLRSGGDHHADHGTARGSSRRIPPDIRPCVPAR